MKHKLIDLSVLVLLVTASVFIRKFISCYTDANFDFAIGWCTGGIYFGFYYKFYKKT